MPSSHRKPRFDTSNWLAPGQCTRCRHVFDGANVEVVARYSDCTVFKCPGCGSSIDDRPIGWGGSFKKLSREEAAGGREHPFITADGRLTHGW